MTDTTTLSIPAALPARGHPAIRVRARDFLRPASVRLEHGHTDAASRYEDWLDLDALDREVLAPLGPGGSGDYLPTFWDATTDRATRAPYSQAPAGAVLILDGAMLLRPGLPCDASVHLHLDPAALARRLPAEQHWELAAYALHVDDARPAALADLVVRLNDPRHPALVTP